MDINYFCKYLEQNGFNDDIIGRFRNQRISARVFPDLTEEDLREMGLTIGERKLILQLQGKNIPKTTQVSHTHSVNYIKT